MKIILLVGSLIFICATAYPQSKTLHATLEGQTSIISKDIPFWMRSNHFGSIPLSGPSLSIIGSAKKDYDTTKVKLFDWASGFEARSNFGKSSELTLIEGYAKVKIGIFELVGGRIKETFGLTDTLLTTGNFAISGNALGIPKVQLAIPNYYTLPFLGKIFSVKGVFSQGWLGEKVVQDKRIDRANTYFHQKALYIRIGKADWRFKLQGGFNDQVFWGHEAEIFESFVLTGWQKYQSVVLGRNWAYSKVGNHVGNVDIRLDYDFKDIRVGLYRQSFYEVGALYHLANIADGINGVVFENKSAVDKKFRWNKILFEFLYTKNQAGEAWSKPTPTGNENYLNHYLYKEGWSYKGLGLGTPFITANTDMAQQSDINPKNFFNNNRVWAVHAGTLLKVNQVTAVSKMSYSRNFGTHDKLTEPFNLGQLSLYLQASRPVKKNVHLGIAAAADFGKLLNNSGSFALKLARQF